MVAHAQSRVAVVLVVDYDAVAAVTGEDGGVVVAVLVVGVAVAEGGDDGADGDVAGSHDVVALDPPGRGGQITAGDGLDQADALTAVPTAGVARLGAVNSTR